MEVEVAHKASSSVLPGQLEKEDDYHVMWQASQSCLAFNQLLKTPEHLGSSSRGSNSIGWQRQESFDQIPGFSLLSTADGDNSPTKSNPTSSGARSSRQPVSRVRHLDARTSPATGDASTPTNPLQIPLFDKTSPAQFLDILKGVSARVNENAGFTGSSLTGSGLPSKKTPRTSRKRPRLSSLSSLSEVKKVRIEESRSLLRLNERVHDYKGKGKASVKPDTGSRSSTPRGQQSVSSRLEPENPSFQDEKTLVEDTSMDIDTPKERTFLRTPSQDVMPPPPGLPLKQRRFKQPASSTKLYPSPSFLPPDPHPSRSSSISSSNSAENTLTKKTKPASTLHPLLRQEPPSKLSQSSIIPPPAFVRRAEAQNIPDFGEKHNPSERPRTAAEPAVASPEVEIKPPLLTQVTSTKRIPVLGMRRASTYPNGPLTTNAAPQRKSGSLPTKLKAFKPPLLALQPTRSQQQPTVVVKQELNLVKARPPLDDAVRQNVKQSHPLQPPTSSNGSSSSESSRSSTSSVRTNSFTTFDSSPVLKMNPQPQVAEAKSASTPKPLKPVKIPIPEPTDGDGDSSFGDMSFDMDALEETLRQYD